MTPRAVLRIAAAIVPMLLLGACGVSDDGGAEGDASITVAAASDLRPAFEELGVAFREATGIEVTFSFGSSGLLKEQVLNGAPFDLFASANVAFVDEVIDAGRGLADTRQPYALGRIVVVTPSAGDLPESIGDLAAPRYRRIAIANPDHAPYGQAAQQALRTAGVLDEVQSRLVYGENVSDTFRLAVSGNVDAAIVALSLAVADGRPHVLVPDDLHEPLEQALVVIDGDRAGLARRFAEFVSSDAGRSVMARSGFVLPSERLQVSGP